MIELRSAVFVWRRWMQHTILLNEIDLPVYADLRDQWDTRPIDEVSVYTSSVAGTLTPLRYVCRSVVREGVWATA